MQPSLLRNRRMTKSDGIDEQFSLQARRPDAYGPASVTTKESPRCPPPPRLRDP
jgi:hypothetical protein